MRAIAEALGTLCGFTIYLVLVIAAVGLIGWIVISLATLITGGLP